MRVFRFTATDDDNHYRITRESEGFGVPEIIGILEIEIDYLRTREVLKQLEDTKVKNKIKESSDD